MNHHDDAQLDAALDAIARPEPPADHVSRVLARTSARDDDRGAVAPGIASAAAYGRPRWLAPALAASVLAVIAAAWQVERAMRPDVEDVLQATASTRPADNGAVLDLNLPVLPPQAYWAMDAFGEFASLRPSTQAPGSAGSHDSRTAGRQPARGRGVDRLLGSLTPALPAGLPPIELEDISPAPVVMPPLASLEDIAFAELPLTPIVITPITEEERP